MDRLPVVRSAVAGLVAFILGYIVTYGLVEMEDAMTQSGGSTTDKTDLVGWVFYNTHFVDTVSSGGGQSQSQNMLSQAQDLTVPEPIWYLIPVVLLVGGGYIAAQGLEGRHVSTENGALAGAGLVIGYLPLAAIGTFFFTFEQSFFGQTLSVAPDQTMGIALAGLGYPIVLGAVGGLIGTSVGSSTGGAAGRGAGGGRGRQQRGGTQQQRGRQQRGGAQQQRGGAQQQQRQQGRQGGAQQRQQGRQQQQRQQQNQQQQRRGGQQGGRQQSGGNGPDDTEQHRDPRQE